MPFLAKTGPAVMKHEDINNTNTYHKLYECMQEVFKYIHAQFMESPSLHYKHRNSTSHLQLRHTQLTFRATNGTNEILRYM